MYCRTSGELVPVSVYKYYTCSLCYQFLMLHNNPVFKEENFGLVSLNNSSLNVRKPIYPDINNSSSLQTVCNTMERKMCEHWKQCCKNAENCCKRQQHGNMTSQRHGHCPPTWDGFSCFDEALAGERVVISCPSYIKHAVPYATAYKDCTSNGTWFVQVHGPFRREWTNYSTCVEMQSQEALVHVGLTCNLISIILLVISCVIFMAFRQLRNQQRIRLHLNLFFSFILTAAIMTMWDVLIYYDRIRQANPEASRMSQNSGGCKLLYTLMRYSQTSNYFWMFCEGFYLHRLIAHAFEVPKTLIGYSIYGWGCAWIPIIIYSSIRATHENLDRKCWIEHAGGYEFIVYIPNLIAVLANMFFFIHILWILLTQLQSHPNEPSNYRRAFRATFVLVPLFGIQWVLVIYRPEPTSSALFTYEIIKTILSNGQGAAVSLIFCLFNHEVHMHLKTFCQKHWSERFYGDSHLNNSITVTTNYTHVIGDNGRKSPCVVDPTEQRESIPLTKMIDSSSRVNGRVTFK